MAERPLARQDILQHRRPERQADLDRGTILEDKTTPIKYKYLKCKYTSRVNQSLDLIRILVVTRLCEHRLPRRPVGGSRILARLVAQN